jgi:hypothetical protein
MFFCKRPSGGGVVVSHLIQLRRQHLGFHARGFKLARFERD